MDIGSHRLSIAYLRLASLDGIIARDVCYRVRGGGGSTTASTGFGACGQAAPTVAVVTLRDGFMRRLRAGTRDAETEACSVNTLAHEWSHAIQAEAGGGAVFTDADHGEHATPVASYVVGALAQCLHLRNRHLAQAANAGKTFDVLSCVEAVGTNKFDASSCTDGWGAQFVRDLQGGALW